MRIVVADHVVRNFFPEEKVTSAGGMFQLPITGHFGVLEKMRLFVGSVRVLGNNHGRSPCPRRLFPIVADRCRRYKTIAGRPPSTVAPCNSPCIQNTFVSSRLTLLPPTTDKRIALRETFRSDNGETTARRQQHRRMINLARRVY